MDLAAREAPLARADSLKQAPGGHPGFGCEVVQTDQEGAPTIIGFSCPNRLSAQVTAGVVAGCSHTAFIEPVMDLAFGGGLLTTPAL